MTMCLRQILEKFRHGENMHFLNALLAATLSMTLISSTKVKCNFLLSSWLHSLTAIL